MPKTTTTKHKSTSFYLSTTVNDYLYALIISTGENKSQIINRLIIQEYVKYTNMGLIAQDQNEIKTDPNPQIL